MRRTTNRAAWAAIAAAGVTLVGPTVSAHADFGDTLKGGCGFVSEQDATLASGTNRGDIYVVALSEEQSGVPSAANVSCWVDVNGVAVPNAGLTAAGIGVVAGSAAVTFSAAAGDQVSVCQQVSFADGSTWVAPDGNTGTDCTPLVDRTFDAITCPVLVFLGQAVGGRLLGAISIGPDGDVYLAHLTGSGSTWVYDCAPYGDGTGSPLVSNPPEDAVKVLVPPTLL